MADDNAAPLYDSFADINFLASIYRVVKLIKSNSRFKNVV